MRVLGAILAGGQARRFGSDKAVAMLDGIALIERVRATLAPQVDAVFVCGRDGGLADCPAGVGPLGGIAAALRHAADHGFAAVVSVPCDTPIIPDDLVASIAGGDTARFVAGLPVVGWWPTTLAEAIDRYLASSDDRSVRAFARVVGARAVNLDAAIPNVNTQADLAALAAGVTSRSS